MLQRMRYAVILVVLLASCGGPSPEFRNVSATRVKMGDAEFDVRIAGLRAEALRLNAQYAPRLASVGPQAVFAIEKVSGCRVHRLTGDQALMQARLDCGQGVREPLLVFPSVLECEAFELGQGFSDLVCYPYP